MRYRYRRGPRLPYLWFLIIPLFFFAGPGHGLFGVLLGIGSIIVIALIVRAVFTMIAGSNTWSMRQNSWYSPRNQQQSYYQPTQQKQQPYYQPTQQQQQPSSSYQQGYQQPYYQPHTDSNQQVGGQQYEAQQQAYDQYEQPQSEYPQEIPPMQQ